jgi:hypothetical protein
MKNQNTKLAAFVAAGAMAAFAAAQADAANLGRNLHTPCDVFVANCQRLNPNPELCRSYSRGRKNMMAIGRLRRL